MDAEKETDSNKSAPSHCKTEREEPSIKNAAEAEGSKNESDAEADGVSQATDEAECALEAKAIEAPEVSGEGGIKGHDPEQTEEGGCARSPHADGPDNLPVLSEAKAQSNAYRCKKCGAALEGDAAFCPKCGTATSPSSAACAGKLKANKKVFGIAGAIVVAAIAAICFAAFRPIPVDTLSITQADKEVYVGYPSSPVKVAYTPTDARQTEITWSSSDESVATVDSGGIVNAMGTGTATITAEAESGATATCEVQCYAIPNFKQIVKDKCNGDSTYCTVAPDGLSLQIDTNPTDSKSDITQSWGDVVASPYVQAANKALGLPDSLWNSMKNTTGSQGKQTKTYGIIEVSWSYLPRHGLEVLYENTSGKTPVSGTTA